MPLPPALVLVVLICILQSASLHPLRIAMNRSSQSAAIDSRVASADALRRQGDMEGAERLLLQAIKISPESIAANDALGELLLAKQRYSEAMQNFEVVLARFPSDSRARAGERQAAITLALNERNSGRGEEALLQLQHARTYLPDDLTLLTDLGIQAQTMHQLTLAASVLNEALKIRPSDPKALYAAARVETDQEHFASAEEHLRSYLAQRPNDASAHYGLGHLLQMQLRTDEARSEFDRSIALQPVQTESYYQIGQMSLDGGRNDEAAQMFQQTLSRMPTHGGALTGMGILAYRSKRYVDARDMLMQAVAAAPEYQPAHYYFGLTLARLGDKEASTRELKIAAELASEQQGKGQPVFVRH